MDALAAHADPGQSVIERLHEGRRAAEIKVVVVQRQQLFEQIDSNVALAVMGGPEPVGIAGLAVADMDLHRRMLAGELADVIGEGVNAPVMGAVDEPEWAELVGAAALLDDMVCHCDHRSDANATRYEDNRTLALRRQYELAARCHRFDAQTWFSVRVQKAGDQRIPFAAPD